MPYFRIFNKASSLIGITLICLFVALAANYFYLQNKKINLQNTSASVDQGSNWKTYKNTKYGFEIQLPNNWFIKEDDQFGVKLSNKEFTSFSGIETPQTGESMILFYNFHSAYENGLGSQEIYKDVDGIIIYDTKYIAESQSFGMTVVYKKQDPNITELKQELDKIIATFKSF